jgi:allantoin racemase
MKIKLIFPLPLDQVELARRESLLPKDVFAPGTTVDCVCVKAATPLSSPVDALRCDVYVVEAGLAAEEEGYDAVVVDAAFDPGLYALRSRLTIPVVGPGIASCSLALTLGKRFSIIATRATLIPLFEKRLDVHDLRDKCASIRAAEVALESELPARDGREAVDKLTAAADAAIADDGADVVVLGATSLHAAAREMSARLPCPVIDPGLASIKMAERLVQLGLSHSKGAFPTPKKLQDEKFPPLVEAPWVPGR